MISVSAVVVSHGHARELETLLPLLAPQVDELVVVANRPGSTPRSLPGATRVIENTRPLRLSANVNLGTAATSEIEHVVPARQRAAERRDQFGAVVEVGGGVRVRGVRPARGLLRVLAGLRLLGAHRRPRASGCLRTKRAMPRACQRVWRDANRRSITWAQSCVTRAAGTYHRSHPARIAR